MSRRKNETSIPTADLSKVQEFTDKLLVDYPERCPNCGERWPLPDRHRCPPEALAEFT